MPRREKKPEQLKGTADKKSVSIQVAPQFVVSQALDNIAAISQGAPFATRCAEVWSSFVVPSLPRLSQCSGYCSDYLYRCVGMGLVVAGAKLPILLTRTIQYNSVLNASGGF